MRRRPIQGRRTLTHAAGITLDSLKLQAKVDSHDVDIAIQDAAQDVVEMAEAAGFTLTGVSVTVEHWPGNTMTGQWVATAVGSMSKLERPTWS